MMSTHTQIASAATLYYKLNEYKVVGFFFMFEIYAWVEYKKKKNKHFISILCAYKYALKKDMLNLYTN